MVYIAPLAKKTAKTEVNAQRKDAWGAAARVDQLPRLRGPPDATGPQQPRHEGNARTARRRADEIPGVLQQRQQQQFATEIERYADEATRMLQRERAAVQAPEAQASGHMCHMKAGRSQPAPGGGQPLPQILGDCRPHSPQPAVRPQPAAPQPWQPQELVRVMAGVNHTFSGAAPAVFDAAQVPGLGGGPRTAARQPAHTHVAVAPTATAQPRPTRQRVGSQQPVTATGAATPGPGGWPGQPRQLQPTASIGARTAASPAGAAPSTAPVGPDTQQQPMGDGHPAPAQLQQQQQRSQAAEARVTSPLLWQPHHQQQQQQQQQHGPGGIDVPPGFSVAAAQAGPRSPGDREPTLAASGGAPPPWVAPLAADDERARREAKQQRYREELEAQIAQRAAQRREAAAAAAAREAAEEAERRSRPPPWDPASRAARPGGGGEPLKDAQGNSVADLRGNRSRLALPTSEATAHHPSPYLAAWQAPPAAQEASGPLHGAPSAVWAAVASSHEGWAPATAAGPGNAQLAAGPSAAAMAAAAPRGRGFMSAMAQLRAGPSEEQRAAADHARRQLVVDLEAQVTEKREREAAQVAAEAAAAAREDAAIRSYHAAAAGHPPVVHAPQPVAATAAHAPPPGSRRGGVDGGAEAGARPRVQRSGKHVVDASWLDAGATGQLEGAQLPRLEAPPHQPLALPPPQSWHTALPRTTASHVPWQPSHGGGQGPTVDGAGAWGQPAPTAQVHALLQEMRAEQERMRRAVEALQGQALTHQQAQSQPLHTLSQPPAEPALRSASAWHAAPPTAGASHERFLPPPPPEGDALDALMAESCLLPRTQCCIPDNVPDSRHAAGHQRPGDAMRDAGGKLPRSRLPVWQAPNAGEAAAPAGMAGRALAPRSGSKQGVPSSSRAGTVWSPGHEPRGGSSHWGAAPALLQRPAARSPPILRADLLAGVHDGRAGAAARRYA